MDPNEEDEIFPEMNDGEKEQIRKAILQQQKQLPENFYAELEAIKVYKHSLEFDKIQQEIHKYNTLPTGTPGTVIEGFRKYVK